MSWLCNVKIMVTRIYTTLRFWHPCAKTPHVLPFLYTSICTCDDEKLEEPFFPLACSRRLSLGHVMAIDPLVDSIPKLTIDWLSGQCGTSSEWDNFFRWFQQRSICWVPATFIFPRTRTFLVHSPTAWYPSEVNLEHGTRTYRVIPKWGKYRTWNKKLQCDAQVT